MLQKMARCFLGIAFSRALSPGCSLPLVMWVCDPVSAGSLKMVNGTRVLKFYSGHARFVSSSKQAAAGGGQGSRVVHKKRRRLDELCVERYPQYSRSLIQSWILQGKVLVDGHPADKAGTSVSESQNITITAEVPRYVCRAGYKLEAALHHFVTEVEGKVVLDAGLSTGGFADCLLQNGASLIYGVDVGYGQVAEKIRIDKRVVVMERTNLRYLPALPQLVLPAVSALMKPDSTLITLIKPQFEAKRNQVGGGGIVRDPEVHKEVLHRIVSGVESLGFTCQGWIESPIKGAEGNTEFLACFHRGKCGKAGELEVASSQSNGMPNASQDLSS